jgi:hypothetical protein
VVAVLAQIAVVILLVVILRWMVFWIGLRKCVGRNKNFKFLSEEGGFQTENLNDQYLVILFGSVDRMDSSILLVLDSVCSRAVYSWTSDSYFSDIRSRVLVAVTTVSVPNDRKLYGSNMGVSILIMMRAKLHTTRRNHQGIYREKILGDA